MMPRLRFSSASVRFLGVMGCVFALSGCLNQTETKTYKYPDAKGRRIVFYGGQNDVIMKWRVVRPEKKGQLKYRVYDTSLLYQGVVLGTPKRLLPSSIEVMNRKREKKTPIALDGKNRYKLGDKLILEKHQDRWRLYDGQRSLLGIVSKAEKEGEVSFLFRPHLGGDALYKASAGIVTKISDGSVYRRASSRKVTSAEMMSFAILEGKLNAMERTVLAVFFKYAFFGQEARI